MPGGLGAKAVLFLLPLAPFLLGALEVGGQAPEFRLKDLEGRERTLSDLRQGGPIVLDFGSVYCASCQEALRRLETLRRPGGMGVAAVNVDPVWAEKAIKAVVKGLRIGYPVVRDPEGTVARSYGVKQIPHLVAVDASGIVRGVHEGLPADLEQALGLETLGEREGK